jgi:uncharacterized protein (DUF1800 family)
MATLNSYDQALTARQVAHLLRRITFGASPENIQLLTGKTAPNIVETFLADIPLSVAPTDSSNNTFHLLPWGAPGADNTEQNRIDATRRGFVKGWWLSQMLDQPNSIIEKMTLFWQNHFVSTATDVSDARFIYKQYQLLRKHALGNFRTFVIEVTKDPAMLLFLDGNLNVIGKPNENYGRELQELFTIGLGNYDETDVKSAAQVLTGWRPLGFRSPTVADVTIEFRSGQHEPGDKTFSSYYQKKVIKGRTGSTAGQLELEELVDMILSQEQTAIFIVRKIYRWFIQSEISQATENDIIKPLADIFRKNYEIKPVLTALFSSQHFFDAALYGSQIKSPLELIIGTYLHFGIKTPDRISDRATYDLFIQYMVARAKEQQMEVFDQATVFGWRPYYDTDFYELWINSTTLALRGQFTDTVVKGNAKTGINMGSLSKAKKVSVPSDPVVLVNELVAHLFAFDLTQAQKDYVIDEVLIPGLPRYEWGLEWNNYTSDPGNIAKENAVKMKLDSVFLHLLRLAEYQMG